MRYTDTHEWVLLDEKSGVITFGITKVAGQELGDVVYIELPSIGKEFEKGEEMVILESTKAAIDLYAPLEGTLVEVNDDLRDFPEKINQDPTGLGWICKLKLKTPSDYQTLLDEASYKKLL